MDLEKIFEKTYFECNVKPLFEQFLREMAIPFKLGLELIHDIVTTDVTKQPDKVERVANKLLRMDRGTNNIKPTFLDRNGRSVSFETWITEILKQIRNDNEKMYSNSLEKATEYIRQVFTDILADNDY